MIKAMGVGAVGLPLAYMLGCGSDDGASDSSTNNSTTENNATTENSSTNNTTTPEDVLTADWSTGGTEVLSTIDIPDPFAAATGTACALTCAATIGPCHTTSPERSDVSEGWEGIPLRLSLKVVDEECEPVEGVIVEIWHTNYEGIYSGDITDMCNDVEEYKSKLFFRGYQHTDAEGRVDFDTCYPGWYTSRVVHIHFRIMTGTYDADDSATAEVISQLFFSDELNDAIFTNNSLYNDFGLPDTQLDNDNVVGGEDDPSPYVCDVQVLESGAMLASKTIILRSSSESGCSLSGSAQSGGMMGPGGPPPGM